MSELRVQLASWLDLDDLVAEVWRDDQYVADVKPDGAGFLVTFRSSGTGIPVEVDMNDLIEALNQARDSLTS